MSILFRIDTGLTLRAFLETKNQPNDNSEPEEARASVSNDRDDILTEDLLMFLISFFVFII